MTVAGDTASSEDVESHVRPHYFQWVALVRIHKTSGNLEVVRHHLVEAWRRGPGTFHCHRERARGSRDGVRQGAGRRGEHTCVGVCVSGGAAPLPLLSWGISLVKTFPQDLEPCGGLGIAGY